MRKIRNLIGYFHGKISVVSFHGTNKGKAYWNCKCLCGREFVVWMGELISYHRTSCGKCKKESAKKTHGRTPVYMYRIWCGMKGRCSNKKNQAYNDYGGRGIVVCERWRNSYTNFLIDMGDRPSRLHTLDRKDNNGNYEPGNCRWATKAEQANNRRSSRIIEYKGKKQVLRVWCTELGLPFNRMNTRMSYGWTIERVFEQPIRVSPKRGIQYTEDSSW